MDFRQDFIIQEIKDLQAIIESKSTHELMRIYAENRITFLNNLLNQKNGIW